MATTTALRDSAWVGGKRPYKASYGKLMMWFFLITDAFTFTTFLTAYGLIRFQTAQEWADPEQVFTHFPVLSEWFHMHPPLAFVGLMTFILIASSVTMVLAVEAGHRMDRKNVEKFLLWTIAGGVAFLACQAYEWYNFIVGSADGGAHILAGEFAGSVGQFFQDGGQLKMEIMNGAAAGQVLDSGAIQEMLKLDQLQFVQGAGLTYNQYSMNPSFANLFFFITGFHGSHVASGVFINYVIFRQVRSGVMDRRGHYEMVEKVGLYWHFVDLVWVFVFTFFYLV